MTHKEGQAMALHVLRETEDGDNLTDIELKVVEWAVNGFLSEAGYEKLREIHAKHCVKEGKI